MAKVSLFKQDGTQAGEVTLNDAVFGIEPNETVVFDVVLSQRASLRQGTHAHKNRSLVSGGGKKPWRQKGTGRARQGSIRSPQFRGGGTVFGPNPRSYAYKLPQKVRQLALKSAYSQKVIDNTLLAVDELNFSAPIERKVLVVLPNEGNEFAELSARNLKNVKVSTASSVSVLDLVNTDKVLATQAALSQIEEVLA